VGVFSEEPEFRGGREETDCRGGQKNNHNIDTSERLNYCRKMDKIKVSLMIISYSGTD
jgi:hypothetical protein